MQFHFTADDEAGTARLGAALAEALVPGTVVALIGTLGAGKTRLVQAIAVACGVEPGGVVSPTFVLIQEYRGRLPIYHIDAYRLRDEDELLALGVDEYFEGAGVTLIEWADRVPAIMPRDRLEIHIDVAGPSARHFTLEAFGERYEAIIARVASSLKPA